MQSAIVWVIKGCNDKFSRFDGPGFETRNQNFDHFQISDFFTFLGSGVGLTASANSLALNTYFRERRRIVTGISWSCTALGPIVFPQIVTVLLPHFGVQGTVLIFSGIAMNAICCSLLLQPVRWHTKKKPKENAQENLIEAPEIECHFCQSMKKKSHSLMSSQYLHNADDIFATGYEIIDPGTPMMARANDGWYSSSSAKRSLYGSKLSLSSKKANEIDSRKASNQNLVISNRPSYVNLGSAAALDSKQKRPKEIREKIEECPSEDCPSHKSPQDLTLLTVSSIRHAKTSPATPTANMPPYTPKQVSESKYLRDNKSNRSMQGNTQQSYRRRSNTFNVEKEVLNVARNKLEEYVNDANDRSIKCTCEEVRQAYKEHRERAANDIDARDKPNFTLWQKFSIFFDLDLLKDFTYINIMIGVTIANFAELNFSVLTPFVLADYGFDKSQIALFMSLLGMTDISVRFFIPFIAGFIGWENRTFFLFGVLGMAMGRVGNELQFLKNSTLT